MNLKFMDEDVIYTNIEFLLDRKCFSVVSSDGMRLECGKDLQLDDEYNPDDYCMELFHTNTLNRENDIFRIFDKQTGVSLGWMFPVQALVSDHHAYAENIFFLKYAYVATYLLLDRISETDKKSSREFLDLTDFYPEDTILLVMCKSNCSTIARFSIWDYVADLYLYGYSFTADQMGAAKDVSVAKKIYLRRISEDVKDKIFIIEIFKSLLVQTGFLPLAKFHMLYQIIELLIGDIFSYEFIDLNQKIRQDTNNLFDLKNDLLEIAGEKYRVNKLFHKYAPISGSLKEELKDVCNEILRESGKMEKKNAEESLYSVRCLMFHEYGSIPAASRSILDDMNLIFEKVVIELLIAFHFPKPISC